jgi:competence/damage-inducible protein CinA-like protein
MPAAEIITIGTEILLGEIVDTNSRFIARSLRGAGIDLYRTTTVGDNVRRIAQAVSQSLERCEIVITTGGLGPTVDDPTREALALAFEVATEFRPELWEQIQNRFVRFGRQPTENNRRQAYVPHGSTALENPVGTAPAFLMEKGQQCVIALPGVPREMEYLLINTVLPYLINRYQIKGVIKTRVLHTSGAGESMIDDRIGDLEALSNPTVGLAAHSGQVDVRIAAKAESQAEADALIAPVEDELHRRLGDWVYGADEETLEEVALRALGRRGWSLAVVEAGLGGELTRRLAAPRLKRYQGCCFRGGEVLAELPDQREMGAIVEAFRQGRGAQVGLGVALYPAGERQDVRLWLATPQGVQEFNRPYGGPPEYGPRWAFNHSLDVLRKI